MSEKIFLLLLILPFFCGGCVTDKDLVLIHERIDKIEVAQKKLSENLASIPESIYGLDNKFLEKDKKFRRDYARVMNVQNNILNDISKLKGELEEKTHEIKLYSIISDTQAKKISSLSKKIDSVENYLDFEKNKASVVSDKYVEKNKVSVPLFNPETAGADELYNMAKKKFDADNFDDAEKLFSMILVKYKKSEKADNAAFWIGEIYYRKGDFKRAVVKYQDVIVKYPKGNKVASSYLKQGLAFFKLGRKKNAKIIFNTLIAKYPSSNEAIIAKRKLSSF